MQICRRNIYTNLLRVRTGVVVFGYKFTIYNNNNTVHDDAITLFYLEPCIHIGTYTHTHTHIHVYTYVVKKVSRYYYHRRNIGPMQIRCRKQVTIIIFVELLLLLLYDIAFCGRPGTTFNIYYIHVIAAVILLVYTVATFAAAVKASLL